VCHTGRARTTPEWRSYSEEDAEAEEVEVMAHVEARETGAKEARPREEAMTSVP